MPGINSSVYYIGGSFTFFLFHVENELLLSIFYLSSGSSMVWYVAPASFKAAFKSFVATQVLAPEYVNDHHRGV